MNLLKRAIAAAPAAFGPTFVADARFE